jgi:steroid Delta-isomerase
MGVSDMSDPIQLVERHVDRFNLGVRTGEFGPMLEGFTEDAEMAFDGVPVGPFAGRTAIAEAYARQPPNDEIAVLGLRVEGGEIVVRYAGRNEPDRLGRMIITPGGDRIARLVVAFDPEPAAGSAEPKG